MLNADIGDQISKFVMKRKMMLPSELIFSSIKILPILKTGK